MDLNLTVLGYPCCLILHVLAVLLLAPDRLWTDSCPRKRYGRDLELVRQTSTTVQPRAFLEHHAAFPVGYGNGRLASVYAGFAQ